MKKIKPIIIFLFCLNLTNLLASDTFIEQYKISKGFPTLMEINKWQLTGAIQKKQGRKFNFNFFTILPNLLRMDAEGLMATDHVTFDGVKGWIRSGNLQPISIGIEIQNDIFRYRNVVCSPYFEDSVNKFTFKFKENTKIGDVPCKLYVVTNQLGITSEAYFSELDTNLIRYSTIEPYQGFEILVDYYFYDYRTIEGVKIPHKIEIYLPEDKNTIFIDSASPIKELREFDFRKQ